MWWGEENGAMMGGGSALTEGWSGVEGRRVKLFHSAQIHGLCGQQGAQCLSRLPPKTLAHYSLLSFQPNLILFSWIPTLPYIYSQFNVLPPNRNCLLSTFPLFWFSLIHSFMEISIDLSVKVLAWLSIWILFAFKPRPKQFSFLQMTKNKTLIIVFF